MSGQHTGERQDSNNRVFPQFLAIETSDPDLASLTPANFNYRNCRLQRKF